MNAPDISVVMAVRNGGERLVPSLKSVLSQTDVSLEVIVVDDGSTDVTPDELELWSQKDRRVRVLTNDRNRGLTLSLIRGCAEARGRYIARHDCGDRSLPGRLASQCRALEENAKLAFVSGWTQYVSLHGEPLYAHRGTGRASASKPIIDLSARYGVIDGPTHHGTVMFRREAYEAVGGYREAFYYGQDWDLWYRLAENGLYRTLPAYIYEATLGPDDISMRNKDRQTRIGALSLRALQCRQAGLSDDLVLAEAANIRPGTCEHVMGSPAAGHYFVGECLRRRGQSAAALREYRDALRRDPWHWRARVRLIQTWFTQ